MDTLIPIDKISKLTFNRKPESIPASSRPFYRIVLLLLVLRLNCRSNTSSFLKLQFFNWLLKDPFLRQHAQERIDSERVYSLSRIHFDPAVNLSLRYALAENLVLTTDNGKTELTEKGIKLVDLVLEDETILKDEKEFLKEIGKKVTEVQFQNQDLEI